MRRLSLRWEICVGRFARLWRKSALPGDCVVMDAVHVTGDWKATYFDELLPAEDYECAAHFAATSATGEACLSWAFDQNTRRTHRSAYPKSRGQSPRPFPDRSRAYHRDCVRNPLRDESFGG